MKRYSELRIYLFAILIFLSGELNAQIAGFNKIRWGKEKIAPGLVWKSSHCVFDDSIPQNINILNVNLNKRKIFIQYDPGTNLPVSKQAASVNAIAAVNGGFFNIKNGGSVTYIRTKGKIIETDTAQKWSRNTNMTGSILIRDGREVFIENAMANTWFDKHPEYDDVLTTGPLLIKDAVIVKLPETSLAINRHPRTAIGILNNKKILLITLDGRTNEATGVTLSELAALMVSLKCRDAVNLDGGGSTTMWINEEPFNGVVNMPCDNKQFDHYGERAVSDILIIK